MEKFLFKKVAVWIVGLLMVAGFVLMIVFGAMVKNVADGFSKFGLLGRVSYELASLPSDLKDALVFRESFLMAVQEASRFPGKSGWIRGASNQTSGPGGYLLLSRYDGDLDRHRIDLVEMSSLEILHSVVVRPENYFGGVEFDTGNEIATPWIPERFRAIHPLALDNGDLLIKDHSGPLARISACGDLVWLNDKQDFHHSIETAPEGGYWIPTRMLLDTDSGLVDRFDNMGIALVGSDGRIVFQKSVGDMLIDAGLEHLLLSVADHFEDNAMHLNDIQPVLADGPFWKKGDVFLSLRALSAIIQYRPSSDKLVWIKQGPWIAQHDVDVLDEYRLSIFNNDTANLGLGPKVRGANKVSVFDFRSGEVAGPADASLSSHDVRTKFGGLHEWLPGGYLMVEETGAGRLILFDQDGEVFAEYFNRAEDGKLYFMGWSRYLDSQTGIGIANAMQSAPCP